MNFLNKSFIGFALLLLITSLFFGCVAALSFFKAEYFTSIMPFQQLRPLHVSAALFWIISAAAGGILVYKDEVFPVTRPYKILEPGFMILWVLTIILVLVSYFFEQYGGREYWEFPPFINLFVLLAWLIFMLSFYIPLFRQKTRQPVYVWMWGTGILFFLFTFIEQNLWHFEWFRHSFIREMTVQWKSNGSMVGAWNQMIYGTSLYIMAKISGDEKIANNRTAYFFYFLGLTNLVFNWGHHIYNIPNAGWIRTVSYTISMTEWIVVINIIQGFKRKLDEVCRFNHLFACKFIFAAEFWVFMNLLLALLMSVPALNRYTHGTHITVAHAMGTTIGINTMILLGSIAYMMGLDKKNHHHLVLQAGFTIAQYSLGVFWAALILAGLVKGYQLNVVHQTSFSTIMEMVNPALKVFMWSGFVLAAALIGVAVSLLRQLQKKI